MGLFIYLYILISMVLLPTMVAAGCQDNYIVLLKSNEDKADVWIHRKASEHMRWITRQVQYRYSNSTITHRYNLMGMQGYSGAFDQGLVAEIKKRSDVQIIEKDQAIHLSHPENGPIEGGELKPKSCYASPMFPCSGSSSGSGLSYYKHDDWMKAKFPDAATVLSHVNEPIYGGNEACSMQTKWVDWGLAQISGTEDNTYIFPSAAGAGVTIYILDTGIKVNHVEFEGRATWGKSFVGSTDDDVHGHGTHVAGIVAGKVYGVAKKANLVAVKVMNDNGLGTLSNIIAGINWVAAQYEAKGRPSTIINLSNGGPYSQTWNLAIDKLIRSGIHFTVAAGNEMANSCYSSPASSDKVIVVGSSELSRQMAKYSNMGPCVSIFAPGSNIKSSWAGHNPDNYIMVSGSSQSAPYVAGVIALYLSIPKYKNYTPIQMKALLEGSTYDNKLQSVPHNTVNRLLTIVPLLKELQCII